MVKEGEVTSPLVTAILAKRIATYRESQRLWGISSHMGFTDRELQVIEQSLRLATKMMREYQR